MHMRPKKNPRAFTALLFAALGFAVGYVAPRGQAARAQAPSPTATADSVPGGFHATGQVQLQTVSATGMGSATTNWTPCAPQGQKCHVEVYYLYVHPSEPTPMPSPCPSNASCINFTGSNAIQVGEPIPSSANTKNVAGTIVITP